MNVNPQIRFIFLALILLVQFFVIITYSNFLAGRNVQLTNLQASISEENLSQGEYRETIAQQLNDQIVTDTRNENIKRINPEETIKLRDLQPLQQPENQNPAPSNTTDSNQSIIAF